MIPWDGATWLLSALFLLQVPGCVSLRGPRSVTGTVGRSLSVQCRYEKEYTENSKYWFKELNLSVLEGKIVETTKSRREVRRGRVSIRDNPANLTFTVTLENLTKGDEGTYGCGIDIPSFLDRTFLVMVSVSPAPMSTSPTMSTTSITTAKTSTVTDKTPTVSTALATVNGTHSANSQEDFRPSHDRGLPVLLSLLALLLLLLAGTSLLAWRMVRRRIKADGNLEPPQNPSQAMQESEPCYANVELQTWPLQEETIQLKQTEMEYSTVQAPKDDVDYATVILNVQDQDSKDDKIPSKRYPQQEPEYSVVKKT